MFTGIESHFSPIAAGIFGLKKTNPDAHSISHVRLARSYPNHIRIILINSNSTDALTIFIKHRFKYSPSGGCFPNSAAGSADVHNPRVLDNSVNSGYPTAHNSRTDGTCFHHSKHAA